MRPMSEPSSPSPTVILMSVSRLRGRRGRTRPGSMGRLARRKMIAPTIARDAQTERLEGFLGAEAHGGVRTTSLWINLPPLAIFAQTPVRCGHRDSPPSRTARLNTPRMEGTSPRAAVSVSSLPAALSVPSGIFHHHDREATSIPPLSPHRRCRWCDGSRADDMACVRRRSWTGRYHTVLAQNERRSCKDDQFDTIASQQQPSSS
jgi:hypothetical protein